MTELTPQDAADIPHQNVPADTAPAGAAKADSRPASEPPRALALMGYAGVVPFVTMSFIIFFLYPRDEALQVLEVQIAYGAMIASFLGGIRWAMAMQREDAPELPSKLATAALPMVAGWITLFLPVAWALLSLIAIFWGQAALDLRASRSGMAPAWYGGYRLRLTILVICALSVSLMGMASR